ncbi:MAG TPA: phosphopantetheine-binding protein [Vicinamibacterales bacterium]|nr:phosphopantetheine-binding protein [Vicinamibacterales bacterium]
MPDGRLGETVAAAVVLKSGAAVSERDVREFAAEQMAAFKVPARVVFVDELPKTPTGKVQRIGMADRLGLMADRTPISDSATATSARPSPQKSVFLRRVVTAIWCDVLGLDDAGEDESFLDLGGDSLLAGQILARIQAMLQVEVSIIALFDEPTIGGLVRSIERAAPERWPRPDQH